MDSIKRNCLLSDLSTVTTTTFIEMIKALLMRERKLANLQGAGPSQPPLPTENTRELAALKRFADKQWQIFADKAVNFCNGRSSHALQLKESLRKGLVSQDSEDRIEHVVNALNAVLLAFHGETVGSSSHTPSEDDLIFVANEYKSANKGKRVTIAGTTVRTLANVAPTHRRGARTSLSYWVQRLATKAWKQANPVCRLPWRDVWHCWDVRSITVPASFDFPLFVVSEKEILSAKELSQGSAPALTTRKRKASGNHTLAPGPKKRKLDISVLSGPIQYESACNGLYLLCSSWDRTHSITFTVQDTYLDIKWYDPQGCISTEPIDITTQLPLLVIAVMLFQRLSSQMRGKGSLDLSMDINDVLVPFEVPETAVPRWELKGRHGVFATPVPVGTSQKQPRSASSSRATRSRARATTGPMAPNRLADLFFKLSWRDERHLSEGSIIATAKERANHYLPQPTHVTDHLPEVEMSADYDAFSTRHIREILGQETSGSRGPSVLVMRKLQPLDTIDPAHFRDSIWQIIRCLRLLWQIGVVHGDVSIWNMMRKANGSPDTAVLIDFDHALVMEPGSRSPSSSAAPLAGTKPFIAMDMGFEGDADPPERLFRHELESVVWCMLWYCQEHSDWLEGSFFSVCAKKSRWYFSLANTDVPSDIRKGAEGLWDSVVNTTLSWFHAEREIWRSPMTDQDWFKLVNRKFQCPRRLGRDWMTFEIPRSKVRRQDRLKGAPR